MHSEGEITHKGRIVQITRNCVDVVVAAQEACGSCYAKNICGTGGQEKLISVVTDAASEFSEGDAVEVSITRTMGLKAVVWAYILPFIFIFTLLLILLQTGCGELLSGLVSLGALALYYVLLFLLKNKLAKEINFKVTKTNE